MYKEGKAKIKFEGKAFLNPEARFSRDLSMVFVNLFAKKNTKILDPTAATGIRGIRYYLETKSKDITLLDINKEVSAMAKKNIKFNKVKAKFLNKSIQEFANTTNERFDVIDLDPFGSVAPNLYDTLKICTDGTYLFLTATDTAVLCGAHEKACLRIYDAKPMHNELCHEVGVRLLLGYVARVAAQFNFGIEVQMSLEYAHYMRLFIRLKYGANEALQSIKSLGYAYYCNKCAFRTTSIGTFPKISKCDNCGYQLETAGKIWMGTLYDKKIVSKLLSHFVKHDYEKKYVKMLNIINDEPDIPLYYSIPRLTKKLGIPARSPMYVIDELRRKGIVATRTQFDEAGVKTYATISDINRILVQKK